ncbi:Na/Pi cotransporter family protein [Paenibacillus koleovorans]|uniref:Na/Pi cotransporter family protein n=1 Tax=Paenibacillus koleovorans TaxID=121608 RepID=UPI000FD931C0|nr:Na/Pi symporter [Paenibacillus koleovorans]
MIHSVLLPLAIGLGVFLTGMKVMELALHQWAGPYLTRLLERFTRTPVRGMLIGTAVTAVLQSSSAITVLCIGLVNAGLMSFPRTLGIILGTNIGSCLTTELMGLNISHYSLPILLAAAAVWICTLVLAPFRSFRLRRYLHSVRCLSLAICGLAAVLLGIVVMQTMVPDLQSRGLFTWFVEHAQRSVLWGVLAGAVVTAIVHSSAAVIAMTMGLAAVQAIPVEVGIAIVIGSNVGTCATALIASIGGSRSGRFVAWSHTLLNAGGAVLFIPLLPLLHEASAWLSGDPSGQIARAQTLFNVLSSLLALPICYLPALSNLQAPKRPRS